MTLNNHELNTEAYYSAYRIIQNGWFPWIKSHSTLLSILKKPESALIWRHSLTVSGLQTIRRMKGSEILKIIKLKEENNL